jgi:recombination protein RecR
MYYAKPLAALVSEFEKMPGIGPKSAQRLAFYVLRLSEKEAEDFVKAVKDVKSLIRTCDTCYNYTEGTRCSVCSDDTRDKSLLCVVAEPRDVIAMERSHEFNGVYHVLHGVISPLNHVTQDDIKVKELLIRVGNADVREVIMATNPDTEGEATAMYISRLLKPFGVKTTRLAYGIPVGSNLEFTDDATLNLAIEGRTEI